MTPEKIPYGRGYTGRGRRRRGSKTPQEDQWNKGSRIPNWNNTIFDKSNSGPEEDTSGPAAGSGEKHPKTGECMHHWMLTSSGVASDAYCIHCKITRGFTGGEIDLLRGTKRESATPTEGLPDA